MFYLDARNFLRSLKRQRFTKKFSWNFLRALAFSNNLRFNGVFIFRRQPSFQPALSVISAIHQLRVDNKSRFLDAGNSRISHFGGSMCFVEAVGGGIKVSETTCWPQSAPVANTVSACAVSVLAWIEPTKCPRSTDRALAPDRKTRGVGHGACRRWCGGGSKCPIDIWSGPRVAARPPAASLFLRHTGCHSPSLIYAWCSRQMARQTLIGKT